MANGKRTAPRNLAEALQKAVRRSEKLERTLLKIVAQSETGSAAEDLLKAVQHGVKKLKKEAKEIDWSVVTVKKKGTEAPEPTPTRTAPVNPSPNPVKRTRKKPQPDTAPASTPTDPNE